MVRPETDALEDDAPLLAPPRPALVELAAAILIVGGVLGLVGLVATSAEFPSGIEPLVVATATLNLASLIIGVLIRQGRAWIVAINYVAVLGFLDLLAAGRSGLALLLGVAEAGVVVILLAKKSWFDAKGRERRWRSEGPGNRR